MRRGSVAESDRFDVADGVTLGGDGGADVTLFSARTARYWQGNSTTSRVIASLQAGRTVGEVIGELHGVFAVDRERLRADVIETVRHLVDARLLRRSAS